MDRLNRLLAALAALTVAMVATGASAGPQSPRIVSLAPHITELLFAAGAGAQVVGATEFSDYPAAARGLPRIGDAFRLDYERIVALHPDVAVAWQSGTPAEVIARLEAAGLPVLVLPVQSLGGIATAIEDLGRLAGTSETALAAAARYRHELKRLETEYAGRAEVRVFIELDHQPLFTVSGRHPISEMVSVCGGRNVFESLPGLAPTVDLEAVLAAQPEAILYTGPDDDPARYWQRWPDLAAVRTGNVLRVPPDLVSRSTPRALEGVAAICDAIEGARSRRPQVAD